MTTLDVVNGEWSSSTIRPAFVLLTKHDDVDRVRGFDRNFSLPVDMPHLDLLAGPLRQMLELLCRNDAERDLMLFGTHSWACARCTGLYVGIALASLLGLGGLRSRRLAPLLGLVAIAIAANGLHVLLDLSSLRSAGWRVMLGGWMGVCVGVLLSRQVPRPRLLGALALVALTLSVMGLVGGCAIAINGGVGVAASATLFGLVCLLLKTGKPECSND